jgi:hypothetical protein
VRAKELRAGKAQINIVVVEGYEGAEPT